MVIFGPVPSRRLGRSLGINHIPPKQCSYSCAYCQLGPTRDMTVTPHLFHNPSQLARKAGQAVHRLQEKGEAIDYLAFVPDGEPTLDLCLGQAISRLKSHKIKIAVITNGSLLFNSRVREQLMGADWVSVKVDAADEALWRKINRPHPALNFDTVLQGIVDFSREFQGDLVTETMLMHPANTGRDSLEKIADFILGLSPRVSYLSVPIRPPADPSVMPPPQNVLIQSHQIMTALLGSVDLLADYEGDRFASTGDVEKDLLSITAVHPMRREAVNRLLDKNGADWSVVRQLIEDGRLKEKQYENHHFYVCNLMMH